MRLSTPGSSIVLVELEQTERRAIANVKFSSNFTTHGPSHTITSRSRPAQLNTTQPGTAIVLTDYHNGEP